MMTRIILSFLILVAAASCNYRGGEAATEKTVANNSVLFARRISIEKINDFTRVTIINPWQGADNVNITYYLVRRGSLMPPGIDSSIVIRVPLRKIVCMSTTHVAMISALGEENSIAGMSGTGFMYSEVLKTGQTVDI